MADNIPLNPGVGGAVMRTLQHADGSHTSIGALAYAIAIADGANVVQIVDASHGMPVELVGAVTLNVEQADETALNATVFQGGEWTVALAGGTVAATQSGAWTVGLVSGTEVKLAAGSTIDLDPNTAIKLAAGTNLVGKVSAGVDGSAIYNGTTALEPKFAKIAASAAGPTTIVAQDASRRIRVLRWGLTADGDVGARWQSGSDDLTGVRPLTKYASAGGAYCPVGCFETQSNEPLRLNLSAAVAVGGELTYVLVPDEG